ncbi:uncharacterized protein LOC110694689 [Chenopodium quinoa]|uniref:uncharacterized protein LOC110694689 n=1 Tax=Chenopodium quinoa TaxID=63459 RepID=UPI000B771C57|nr:uncharacterized protein LOC110694689 [Chenopodium quinoa]
MAASLKLKPSFRRLKCLFPPLRFCHTITEKGSEAEFFEELGPKKMVASDVDTSKWKKMDARELGLSLSMIPYGSRTVVKILQSEGHDAYFVGGCVRDLLLNKIPKDFDVVTSAKLREIKKKFDRAFIVGRRFPICKVHVRGSEVEVSSFETVTSHDGEKEEAHLPEMPKGYDEKDLMRWRNSLHRDFTINSLFYDPFAQKVYDYTNGMTDLLSMKLRTLAPAQSSFQADCARILRGLRIAARLGFLFTKETEKAIQNLYLSVKTLDKARLMMEMNYMLSYGASQSSFLLLQKFKLLGIFLPFHAAYLADQSPGQTPVMLMKLFSNLDNVISCDQPCDSVLWVSLLVFHLALVNNPQEAFVVWTFSSLLYHGTWDEGVKAARELSEGHVNFTPEIFNFFDDVAEEELAERVSEFASIVLDSIGALTDSKILRKIMARRYPSSPCPAAVFISKKAGKAATAIFDVLEGNIKYLKKKRHCYGIDYELLGKGDIAETRFVLGKVIMDTMRGGITNSRTKLLSEKKDGFHKSKVKVEQMELGRPNSKDPKHETQICKGKSKRNTDGPDDQLHQQSTKKLKQSKSTDAPQELVNKQLDEILSCQSIAKRKQQHKKEVVKDVNNFLSLPKDMPQQDSKLEIRQHKEAEIPKEIPVMLKKVPTMEKQLQTLDPNEILHVLETFPTTEKQQDAVVPEEMLDVLEDASSILKQHKTQASVNVLNVLNLSNLFEGDEDPSKPYRKPKKQPAAGKQCQNGSNKKKRIPKLSSIFK